MATPAGAGRYYYFCNNIQISHDSNRVEAIELNLSCHNSSPEAAV